MASTHGDLTVSAKWHVDLSVPNRRFNLADLQGVYNYDTHIGLRSVSLTLPEDNTSVLYIVLRDARSDPKAREQTAGAMTNIPGGQAIHTVKAILIGPTSGPHCDKEFGDSMEYWPLEAGHRTSKRESRDGLKKPAWLLLEFYDCHGRQIPMNKGVLMFDLAYDLRSY